MTEVNLNLQYNNNNNNNKHYKKNKILMHNSEKMHLSNQP